MGFQSATTGFPQQLDDALRALSEQDVCLIWMLDRYPSDAISTVRDLADRHPNLSALFGCTPQVARQAAVQLGRCPMQFDLSPLSVDDACEYVQFCLERAGCNTTTISDNTTVRLHEITGGVIGRLAVAAESSLVLAASHKLDRVTPAVVEAFAEHHRRAA